MPDLPEVRVLVCARAADAVAGSTFGRTCCQCHKSVAVAPSGQTMLASTPDMAIMCSHCAVEIQDTFGVEILPGALEEAITDMLTRLSERGEKKPE